MFKDMHFCSGFVWNYFCCRNSKDKYNINYDVSKMFIFYGCVKSESYLQSSNFLFDIA